MDNDFRQQKKPLTQKPCFEDVSIGIKKMLREMIRTNTQVYRLMTKINMRENITNLIYNLLINVGISD